MIYTWLLWFGVAVLFAVIELVTVGFFMIWFGVGALAAMLTALLTNNLLIQFLVFIMVSVALLFMTRKLTSKLTKGKVVATNVDAVIGKIGMVTEDIPALDNPGIVKLAGEMWSAISADSQPIEKGTLVEVLQVKGVKLVVQKSNSEKG
ncbi:MAG TPA: NfeD family protein [Epulopiscium sp.]|nr:NfeD family protein [Candidatus Epulonipiscium sp.]